jgi:LPXTG-motif cell wall-anchored protein
VTSTKAELGPRYRITWTIQDFFGGTRTLQVNEDLYPWAEGGPVLFRHAGNEGGPGLKSGWIEGHPALLANLEAWGFPAEQTRERSASPDGKQASSWTPWVIAGTLLAGGVSYLTRRRRRAASFA